MDLLKNFQFYPDFRKYQKEAILEVNRAFNSGKKFVILEAPTGIGKSPIGMTFARAYESTNFLTIQKLLQDQYINDFNDIVPLKGRNAYPCLIDSEFSCAEGLLCYGKGTHKSCLDSCIYRQQVNKVEMAKIALFNFHSFIFQTLFAGRFTDVKDLMIIDECHNQENCLMDFMQLAISEYDIDTEIPDLNNAQDYMVWFKENYVLERLKTKLDDINASTKMSTSKEDRRRLISKGTRIENKINAINNLILAIEMGREFITEVQDVNLIDRSFRKLIIKPVYAYGLGEALLYKYADRVLMMSATVLNPEIFCSSLSIPQDEVHYISVPCIFDPKHRPIYLEYAGPMSYRNKRQTLPILIRQIKDLLKRRPDQKGIIHTHSREIQRAIHDSIDSKRLVYDWDFIENKTINKYEVLDRHFGSNNSIIVAPAWHEGVDLKNEHSRFQVICKVPYPSLADKRTKIRMQKSSNYYQWLTALKIVQSYGRSIRSEDDWADTFIYDSDFDNFLSRAQRMLPSWFREAIVRK